MTWVESDWQYGVDRKDLLNVRCRTPVSLALCKPGFTVSTPVYRGSLFSYIMRCPSTRTVVKTASPVSGLPDSGVISWISYSGVWLEMPVFEFKLIGQMPSSYSFL